MSTEPKRETYLGDGVYAYDDGYHIVLRTDRGGSAHWIALDADVIASLFMFIGVARSLRITTSLLRPDGTAIE